MADFKYGIFDGQIILVTNLMFLKNRKMLTKEKLLTLFTQTVMKCVREMCDCDRVFLVWDTKPYHRTAIIPHHKANRFHINRQFVKNFSETPSITPSEQLEYIKEIINENRGKEPWEIDEIVKEWKNQHPTEEQKEALLNQYSDELFAEELKEEVKRTIISEFWKLGLPSLSFKGYEADDLAYICSRIFEEKGVPYYLCSKDSDWRYLLGPYGNILRYHRQTMEAYSEVAGEVPAELREKGVSLLTYKAMVDSIGGSHNNYEDCRKEGFQNNWEGLYEAYRAQDIESLETFCDSDLFLPQMKSFFVEDFEDHGEIKAKIAEILSNPSSYPENSEEFREIADHLGLNMSNSYYEKFKSLLNPEDHRLFSSPSPSQEYIDNLFDNL